MASVEIVEIEDIEIKNKSVIIGFPDVGLVGSILALNLVEQLKLKEVGYIESEIMPPIVFVHDKHPKSPIRIYSKENIVVLFSEIPMLPSMIFDISTKLIDWIKSNKPKITFIVGGIPIPQRLEIDSPKVYGVGSSKEADEVLHKNNIAFLEEGILVGLHGVLLKKCSDYKIPAVCLLAESHYNIPDPSAAASILTVLNEVLDLNVEVKKLIEDGEKIRIKARDLMKRTYDVMSTMQKSQEHDMSIMYR